MTMERKIGEIFEHSGEWYQCVEGRCKDCYFAEKRYLCKQVITKNFCTSNSIFKKLEKVGEPYEYFIQNIGIIMLQEYILANPSYIWNDDKEIFVRDCFNGRVAIAIKQNQEDMEEKKIELRQEDLTYLISKIRCDILPKYTTYDEITEEITKLFTPVNDAKLSNLESTGKNLKPFDLEAARKGKPVCTREGRKARIICFDLQDPEYDMVALLLGKNGFESICTFNSNGRFNDADGVDKQSKYDLMMLPEKHEGWVNVYKDSVYDTKYKALIGRSVRGYIDTIKIEYYE